MTKHQPPKHFETTSPTCPVADLALRFGAAEREWRALDGANVVHADDALVANENTLSTLTDMASIGQPASAMGALFQVLIVSQQADLIYANVDAEVRSAVRRDVVRLEGALWGIRRFLETHFSISAADIGGDYMMLERASFAGKLRDALAASKTAEETIQLQAAE